MLSINTSSASEVQNMKKWASAAFCQVQSPEPAAPAGIDIIRQDFGNLCLCKSVMKTRIHIGGKPYSHGLGTHAVSVLTVTLPKPGKTLRAEIGVDNNFDTVGIHGSVVFVVSSDGRELYRSGVCRGGDDPLPIKVDLNGATEFTLAVENIGDGVDFDQADWANASVTLDDGKTLWLDEMPASTSAAKPSPDIPFSFVYGGRPSAQIIKNWKKSITIDSAAPGIERYTITYLDRDSGLQIKCEAKVYDDYPAVEWVLYMTNTGASDTPMIEDIRPLDMRIAAPAGQVTLHHSNGSTCASTDFLPVDQSINPGSEINLAPNGGRSSDGNLPFFNLEWNGGGLAGAVGWSGQWALRLRRDADNQLTLQAGQQVTHLKLHPGESIRTPRILLVNWQGLDWLRGNNFLRQVMLKHYIPKNHGEFVMPMFTQTGGITTDGLNAVNEKNLLAAIKSDTLGIEGYWLDAGWFQGGWPFGAGSWVPDKEKYPHGLKPISDAAHARGMKFILWFEPERVTPISQIWKEHPEWVMHLPTGGDGLFNLGDPAARQWLTDFLSKCIQDWGVDVYRNDFNIPPLGFWQAADAPDRQGMAENQYISGLYAMWDEIIKRKPGVWIDNCASGGRRIDLETMSRSIPLWKSDTPCCNRAIQTWDQAQIAGLSLYVAPHSSGLLGWDDYTYRSVVTTGITIVADTGDKRFDKKHAAKLMDETKSLRPYFLGDYYPLTEITTDDTKWCGWQFNRPDMGRGFAMLFRRPQCPYSGLDVTLRGLEREANYEVTYVDTGKKLVIRGSHANLKVEIDSKAASSLITYSKVGK